MKTQTRLHFLSKISPLEKLISACAHTGDTGAKTQTDLHTLRLPGWKDEYPFENLDILYLYHYSKWQDSNLSLDSTIKTCIHDQTPQSLSLHFFPKQGLKQHLTTQPGCQLLY